MKNIFISYRRADTATVVGRVYDRLVARFGRKRVFKDVDDIPLAEDFRVRIERAIVRSGVQLIVIGTRWLYDEQGRNRLQNPNDPVRWEMELALQHRLRIIPLLVDGAVMPPEELFPDSIRAIAKFNGRSVRSADPDFDKDIRGVLRYLQPPISRRTFVRVGVGVVGVAGLSIVTGSGLLIANHEGALLGTRRYCVYSGHRSLIRALAWSPDGQKIASASEDGTVQVWTAATGSLIVTFAGHSGKVTSVAWSPDGAQIASTGEDATVHVWEAATGKVDFVYRGHDSSVSAVAWSPDGALIASGGGRVQVWSAKSGTLIYTFDKQSAISSLAWSPDGSQIVSASDSASVLIWDATTGKNVLHIREYEDYHTTALHVAWAPNGGRIAVADEYPFSEIEVFPANQTHLSNKFEQNGTSSLAWAPNSARIVSGSAHHTDSPIDLTPIVQVWNASDGQGVFTYRGHPGPVFAVAWSPDGSKIASGGGGGGISPDYSVQVWQAN